MEGRGHYRRPPSQKVSAYYMHLCLWYCGINTFSRKSVSAGNPEPRPILSNRDEVRSRELRIRTFKFFATQAWAFKIRNCWSAHITPLDVRLESLAAWPDVGRNIHRVHRRESRYSRPRLTLYNVQSLNYNHDLAVLSGFQSQCKRMWDLKLFNVRWCNYHSYRKDCSSYQQYSIAKIKFPNIQSTPSFKWLSGVSSSAL